ncbi:hypothetical protein AXF42_Ash013877 [Apostasia shenzhenica]|uniref:RING-CH-type domain-containing protein n=1 Tax=Apostasia shenzhenica TaxID=1088818 RepID=A0A2I0AS42_9ASPA|nr:hypothetical protein AXF42_Ash013877 [Apostasia shenzhenica]
MALEEKEKPGWGGVSDHILIPPTNSKSANGSKRSSISIEKDPSNLLCRVCHCDESDLRGDAALGFLDIEPPPTAISDISKDNESAEKDEANVGNKSGFVEFISPDGDVFVCKADVESCSRYRQDTLIDLGCSCKNDLGIAHYACALKWFISQGSTVCEICGTIAKNVKHADFKKILATLKEYESLREKTTTHVLVGIHTSVDPDALAAIRRQRLCDVSLWFNPSSTSIAIPQEVGVDQPSIVHTENTVTVDSPTIKWAVEGTGILVATGLLTVTLAWLIAPHVGKKIARNGLHILLGGIIALTVVIFLRFVILSRIRYGPARYWAILFVFWFLVFGIWASRTHSAHST